MADEGLIHGINPSIAKVVYYLNCAGYLTLESHAGFYPGDEEEQEYWIQKEGMDRDHNNEIVGPIVLVGIIFKLPYVIFLSNFQEKSFLSKKLPKNWIIEKLRNENPNERDSKFKLSYHDPRLTEFGELFNEIYYSLIEKYDKSIEEIVQLEDLSEINLYIEETLSLSREEFNSIRDNGIKCLEITLIDMIMKISNSRAKELADRITGALSYYKKR